MNPSFHLDEPIDGAHRLTLRGAASHDRWHDALGRLGLDLSDVAFAAGHAPAFRLTQLGWEVEANGARAWWVGDSTALVALVRANLGATVLHHLDVTLGGALETVTLQSQPIGTPGYAMVTRGGWPWRSTGAPAGRRVVIDGDAGEIQMRGLADALAGVVRTGEWSARLAPNAPPPYVEGDTVHLPLVIDATSIRERVWIWARVWWVDVRGVEIR
ncbi:MAG TPA: hypothetical protein PKA64_09765 [Myxococcota bacterium]|nr:hypothetical protein [Myxococcota bacterium]